MALVVGVGDYAAVTPLRNTKADAAGVSTALKRLGFEVRQESDPTRARLESALRQFGADARGAEASLFFYAGHAIEIQGKNWLIPVDAKLEGARDVRFEAVDVEAVLEQAQAARVALLFLDACRNNPFAEKLASGARGAPTRGLARIEPTSGVFVAFATAPGQVAYDGTGDNSPFTQALLRHIEQPGLEIRQMMSRVRADVRRETKDQAPWEQSALEGEFYFKAPPETPKPTTFDLDALFWDSVRNSAHREDFAAYLERFPNGAFAVLAKSRMAAAPSARQGAPAEAAKAEAAAKPPEAASSSVDPPKSVELSSLSRTTASPEQAKPEATAPVVIASLPERSGQGALAPDFAFERFFGGMAPEAVRAALAAYRAGKAPKALAVSGDGKQVWRAAGRASMLDAQEGALEGCEFLSRAPCRLVSSEDGVGGEVAGDGEFRVMPRLATSGAPAAATTPFVGEPGRTSPWLAAFLTQSGPKALALHPSGQADWASGATQREAEAKALADCERARPPDEIACVLYAAGDEIVLARRATSAIALEVAPPAAPIVSTPVAPKAAPTPQRAKPAAKPQPRQARRPPVEAADEPAPRRNAPQRAAPRPAKPKAERARQEPPAARQRCFSAGGRTYCS